MNCINKLAQAFAFAVRVREKERVLDIEHSMLDDDRSLQDASGQVWPQLDLAESPAFTSAAHHFDPPHRSRQFSL